MRGLIAIEKSASFVSVKLWKFRRGSGEGRVGGAAGVGFGGAPAGVDLVKGARRIRASAARLFTRSFPHRAANPAGPRRGRRPLIARQPLPTDPLSAPQLLIFHIW